jgi:ferredoxin-NADP reductase
MADRKIGSVVHWENLSSILSIFRLMPQEGSTFPDYKPGQYIALRRDDCNLTRKNLSVDGKITYVPDLDEQGNPRRGPVTHSYSISSAPYETSDQKWLEFYIILEKDEFGHPGRLTESFFRMDVQKDNQITYVDRITGDFTLDKRASGFQSVLLVGTGTGLAPFAAMIKQLHRDASNGGGNSVKYTLLHTNRVYEELGYHQELMEIQKGAKFDFRYISSVSRPTPKDLQDPTLSVGRANNLLRYMFDMPLKEEQELQEITSRGEDVSRAKANLEKTVKPQLKGIANAELQQRFTPSTTVILTCGNPYSMADIKYVADANQIRFEKEDW